MNLIQEETLNVLKTLRLTGGKKGLVISATGTCKSYISAFDVRNVKLNRVLFIAHLIKIFMLNICS